MIQEHKEISNEKPSIGSGYSRGDYFADPRRFSEDAQFKVDNFLKVFLKFLSQYNISINSLIDVGCGSGDIVKMITDALRMKGLNLVKVRGYDVSPHVKNIKNEGVDYIFEDFSKSDEFVDVVTLFDVFEHVPDTIEFIKSISERCRIIGFHIPLDDSLDVAMRDMFHKKLINLGHLIFLDIVSALNLLALSGLKVVDYGYSFNFMATSRRRSIPSKIIFPIRYLLSKISPWLLSKTLGGVSLVVIAFTPKGVSGMQ